MGVVTIEDGDEERSIVTPDLRLRFRWIGDRWTHAIDLRPGPWQTVAEAVEGTGLAPGQMIGPTYQDVHFQRDGGDVIALAVGQAGAHHYSASFRVRYRAYRKPHFDDANVLQDRSESRIEIDVADRCRTSTVPLEAHYLAYQPPISLLLGDSDDSESADGFSRRWKPFLVWEVGVKDSYHVALTTPAMTPASRVAIVDRSNSGEWRVRIGTDQAASVGTGRLFYHWEHARVNAFKKPRDSPTDPPWSLVDAPSPSDLSDGMT